MTDAATLTNDVMECLDLLRDLVVGLAYFYILVSLDPNDKKGIVGVGSADWIKGSDPLFYSVYFLNEPTAKPAAHEIAVTDFLDASIDLSTFNVQGIVIGGQNVQLSPTITPSIGQYQEARRWTSGPRRA
jgi:hypothetical protein